MNPDAAGHETQPLGRRLTLTPISLDIIVALAHDPDGLRLTPLATAISAPVSSVQAALRVLMANGLVRRNDETPPPYALAPHPARDALIGTSILLPEAAHALGVALRSSSAVAFAAVDRDGFVAGLDPKADDRARVRLSTTLEQVAAARPDAPPVEVMALDELLRIRTVSIGLRARLDSAIVVKGSLGRRGAPTGTAAHPLVG